MCIGRNMKTARLFRLLLLSVTIAVSSLLVLSDARAEILVIDDFENPARSRGLWEASNTSVLRVVTDPAKAHSGSGVLEFEYHAGTTGPGYLGASFGPVPEVYVRWYEKYEAGWTWSGNGQKLIKIQTASKANWMLHTQWGGSDPHAFPEGAILDKEIHQNVGGKLSLGTNRWYCIEVRAKQDTGGSNGLLQMWIDGVLKLDISGLQLATQLFPYNYLLLSAYYNEGESTPNGVPHLQYRWIDDVAASTTRIGCLPSTGDKNPPSAPSGLRLMSTGQ
jgi:hypothetical protein